MKIDEIAADYQRDGVVRVEKWFSPDELDEVRRELDRYVDEVAPRVPDSDKVLEADGRSVRNLWRMQEHDAYFASLGEREPVRRLAAALVGGEPALMGVETFNKPAKVGSGVPPHQDNAYFCQAPPDMLTIWIAMDAATLANGPIYYLKASHRDGVHPHRPSGVAGNSMGLVTMPEHDKSDVFCGTLDPGDALVHHCQTIHWSERNKTDLPRCGLLMVYRGAHTTDDPKLKAAYEKARSTNV